MVNPEAVTPSMPSGRYNKPEASTNICSENPPERVIAITLSPSFTPLTFDPILSTTPATSPPGENGSGGLN